MTNNHITEHGKTDNTLLTKDCLDKAQGCLMGQLIGDALGSLVEFQNPASIISQYPNGVKELEDGGTWNTIAGQPSDDSELALMLARTLLLSASGQLMH